MQPRTIVGINNLIAIDQLAYANHCQFWYRLGKTLPDNHFTLCNPRRMSIDRMRNFAAKVAVEQGFDYLMFFDDDVLIPIDTYHKLVAANKDIVSGITLVRGYPYYPMVFDFDPAYSKQNSHMHDYVSRVDPATGLIECSAVGFSCVLIKVDLLRKMRPPYFITGENFTEDIYFCQRAKQQFPEVQIFAHHGVQTAHITGSGLVDEATRPALMLYDETLNPGLKPMVEAAKTGDRGDEYFAEQIPAGKNEGGVDWNF